MATTESIFRVAADHPPAFPSVWLHLTHLSPTCGSRNYLFKQMYLLSVPNILTSSSTTNLLGACSKSRNESIIRKGRPGGHLLGSKLRKGYSKSPWCLTTLPSPRLRIRSYPFIRINLSGGFLTFSQNVNGRFDDKQSCEWCKISFSFPFKF
jgi:hypothetical protein